jgi:hypothetical protein
MYSTLRHFRRHFQACRAGCGSVPSQQLATLLTCGHWLSALHRTASSTAFSIWCLLVIKCALRVLRVFARAVPHVGSVEAFCFRSTSRQRFPASHRIINGKQFSVWHMIVKKYAQCALCVFARAVPLARAVLLAVQLARGVTPARAMLSLSVACKRESPEVQKTKCKICSASQERPHASCR